ncbi:MAG: RsmB/NOP family class I SAM-dependent RNA methyltransferase [Bacteroidota bacterium]|nr:RsmB/NOP family class I SAM-dependent RNA methyltransferase [Bacteroidota bacterium]
MKENVVNLYLNTSIQLVEQYIEEANKKFVPLNAFLKGFFKKHSKYGKRDRNNVSELVYAYFRVGNTFPKDKIEERITLGAFLCNSGSDNILYFLCENKLDSYVPKKEVKDRIKDAAKHFKDFKAKNFFPFDIELSDGLSKEEYFHSFLQKPSTFIRMWGNMRERVIHDLQKNEIAFEEVVSNENALRINSSKNLSDLDSWKKGYFEVQDLSSQQTAEFLHPKANDQWWDVCAASGGKSLLLLSKEKNIYIFASDVRKHILENYKERIKRTNFLNFETKIIDLADSESYKDSINKKFDGIICDAPCSGSGTWHRTPENLFFFTPEKLEYYCDLQNQIVKNTLEYIKPGKPFIYITCSVFKKENEGEMPAQSSSHQLINNFDKEADCMFIATA